MQRGNEENVGREKKQKKKKTDGKCIGFVKRRNE